MSASLVLVALVSLGLPQGQALAAPADGLATDLPAVAVDAGPVAAATDGLQVSVDSPLAPVNVDTGVLCMGCPSVSVGQSTAPAPSSADSKGPQSPLAAVLDAPPAAVAAGSSLVAGGLGLAFWLTRPAFGLFSRIEDGELATHPLRRQALDFIASNPGASLQDVRRALGIAWGTTVYHLGRLERAGLVAVRHVGGRRGHWPLGQAPARDALAPGGQALVELVRQRPGLSQQQLAAMAGMGAPSACKQLRRLEQAGVVLAHKVGRSRVYEPALVLAA